MNLSAIGSAAIAFFFAATPMGADPRDAAPAGADPRDAAPEGSDPRDTASASADPRDAPPPLETIALWLATNFDLPTDADVPALVTVPDAELVTMRYGPGSGVEPGDVVAVYDDVAGAIYLADGWTGSTPTELSVLVHEMVHHLQAAADMRFACPGEREKLAYRAQDAWLGLFGESLESAFGIDAATLLVGTSCAY